MSKLTTADLIPNRDKFLDQDNQPVEFDPAPGTPFPIGCGPWPNPNSGALCVPCFVCKQRCGISPKGYAYHRQNDSLRPMLCPTCFVVMSNILRDPAVLDDPEQLAKLLDELK